MHFVVMPATPFPTLNNSCQPVLHYATAPLLHRRGMRCAACPAVDWRAAPPFTDRPAPQTTVYASALRTTAAPPSKSPSVKARMLDDGVTVEWTITVVNNSASNAQLTPVGFQRHRRVTRQHDRFRSRA